MWSTDYIHEAAMIDRLPGSQSQCPKSCLSLDIARNELAETLNIPSCRGSQDKASFRNNYRNVVTDKTIASQKATAAKEVKCTIKV